MRAYSFNKNKITRSFILISFIYSLKTYNISPEIHLCFYLMLLDGFLAKYCIYFIFFSTVVFRPVIHNNYCLLT